MQLAVRAQSIGHDLCADSVSASLSQQLFTCDGALDRARKRELIKEGDAHVMRSWSASRHAWPQPRPTNHPSVDGLPSRKLSTRQGATEDVVLVQHHQQHDTLQVCESTSDWLNANANLSDSNIMHPL